MNKILIDATSFQRKKTGIETYGFELTHAVFIKFLNSNINIVFLFDKMKPKWFYETTTMKAEVYSGNSKLLMEQIWIPLMCLKHKSQKIFFPVFPPSIFFLGLKLILNLKIYRTIFDTIMWKFPDTTSLKNKLYMRPLERIGTYYYDSVFTISQNSKNDIENLFPHLKENVFNASIGIKNMKINKNVKSDILDRFNLQTNKYLLFVGTIEPRKNVEFILSILDKLNEKTQLKLCLAGRIGWGHKKLMQHPLYKKLKNNIVITDFIIDDELTYLYKNALIFIFPSFYEGFGLPIVEAMQQGTLVVAADNSSIPEAIEDAGILVKGYNIDVWVSKIIQIKDNYDLRNELINAGFKRIKKLSWENTANIIFTRMLNGNS